MSVIQPIIWMGLFGRAMNIGAVFTNVPMSFPPSIPPQIQQMLKNLLPQLSNQLLTETFGTSDYFSFMSVGILAFVVLFTTMFSAISIVWDRRLGFLNKVLSTPVARGVIIISKVLSAVGRSLAQAAIVLVVAVLLGLKFNPDFTALNIVGVFAALFLMCIGLSSLFIMIALRSTRWETQMAVMNLLNLPLLFASNALFPTHLMPDWLQAIAKINPVTYCTDAVRQLTIQAIDVQRLAFDFTFLGVFAVVFATIGIILSWRYLSR